MTHPNPPTDPNPPTGPVPPSRLRRLALIPLAVVLTLCGALGAVSAVLGQAILSGTVEAGRGTDCPACAVDVFIRGGPVNVWGGDDLSVAHVMCAKRRTQLRQQLRDFATAYHQAAAAVGVSARLETGKTVYGRSPSEIADGHTWLTIRIHHTLERPNSLTVLSHSIHEWRFEVVNEDGWRVCTAELPEVCGNLIICHPPTPTPVKTPGALALTRHRPEKPT